MISADETSKSRVHNFFQGEISTQPPLVLPLLLPKLSHLPEVNISRDTASREIPCTGGLAVDVGVPAGHIRVSRDTEVPGGREVDHTGLSEVWLDIETDQARQKRAHRVADRQQAQRELLLVGVDAVGDGMGRVENDHSRHEAEGGAQDDDDRDVGHEVVPRLEQEKDQVAQLNGGKDPGLVALEEAGHLRTTREQEQVRPAYELADAVRQRVVQEVVARQHVGTRKGNRGHHRRVRQILREEAHEERENERQNFDHNSSLGAGREADAKSRGVFLV